LYTFTNQIDIGILKKVGRVINVSILAFLSSKDKLIVGSR